MLRERNSVLQFGVGLVLLGIVVKVALALTVLFNPLANWAIGIGVLLAIVGLVLPGKKY